MFINEYDLDLLYNYTNPEDTPNLYAGIEILDRLVTWTNMHSDGWAYWPKPSRAANQLMILLNNQYDPYDPVDITESQLKKALAPIKAFLTRRGVDHSLIFH